ncbi:MAG TPA: hypothetical protein VK963_01315 [Candidatus Saccharimonadales bacterium]|nr:hypothetical protein [Candidatus Saccharimonadales bacterium]
MGRFGSLQVKYLLERLKATSNYKKIVMLLEEWIRARERHGKVHDPFGCYDPLGCSQYYYQRDCAVELQGAGISLGLLLVECPALAIMPVLPELVVPAEEELALSKAG